MKKVGRFSTETCVLSDVKQVTSASLMHDAGHSEQALWTTQRDGAGRELGGAQEGETHVHSRVGHGDDWQKPPQYCKEIILQLKQIY